MNEEENIALIEKGKFLHKECCHFDAENDYCAYWQKVVTPDRLACIIFSTCNKCSKRAVRVWDKLTKKCNKD